MHVNQDEKSSTEDEKRLALNSESWLKTEFEQSFQQMRDRDARIIEIVKFYATVVLGVATAIVALMGLKEVN